MKQNVKIKLHGRIIKIQFEHCKFCKYLTSCYSPSGGPNFLEPSCVKGPVQ